MHDINRFAFFALQRMIGSRAEKFYDEFLELEKARPEQVRELQEQRISSLLHHAVSNVPYYRELVSPRKDLHLEQFPVLTKEDLRSRFADLMTNQLRSEYSNGRRHRGYSWLAVQTGGSTGVPTTVIHGPEFRDRGRAARAYSQYLAGFPIGTPYFRLWGSMREINAMKDSFPHRVVSYLSNETVLNAFRMEESTIRSYVERINQSQINFMMAYVDAAYEVARYALQHDLQIRPLKAMMACAGTVTEDIRKTIEAAFGCRIHNKYGSRDCAELACECDRGGLHEYSNNIVVEIVDENNRVVPVGETGRILVTLLANDCFPIVRYEIGDVGALKHGLCTCGRPTRLLDRIEGRSVEFLLTSTGGYVSPVYVRHLIGVVHNPGIFRRYQLVQHTLSTFDLNLEVERGAQTEAVHAALHDIERDLKAVFGATTRIQPKFFDEIPPSSSGKFLASINLVPRITAVESYGIPT